ncbi:putative oxidoreductase [Gordonia namibiensis NBRC 108229]|uniref:Putative oxidoreductase n=1 Tax=Gordonia namibiensis NBRC 108229 TaxID=1208314 RepID=K6WPK7_9ACTN|nr:SDR family oxidoreductase [Gordonia namibiensis]GAC01346.1 putative oxidoreductase [Gordonia namibiensis NBRC 108229]
MSTGGGTYVVTGSASGMGAAVAKSLCGEGHTVIGVDLRDADVVADLSTPHGRQKAAEEVLAKTGGKLDGAVLAAGMGPTKGRERMITEVNVLGVTDLLTAWRPALAAADKAKVVVFGSNSTTVTPLVPRGAIRRLINGDTVGATRQILRRRGVTAPVAYAASKIAVTQWVRWQGTKPEWAGAGIRINVIAPGPVMTPLLQAQLDSPQAKAVTSFPVPVREFGTPEQLAAWVMTMLSPAADFMAGTIITVDGGTEALMRTRDWPRPLPVRGIPKLLWKMYRAPKDGQVAQY